MTGATGAAALAASKVLTGGRPSDSGKLWASVLQELPLFAGVSKRHVRKIANLAKEARFSARSRIVRRGEPGNAFFVILDGEASVVRVAGLPAVPLTVGDSFGEMALLDGGTRSATVVASTNVLCLRLSRAPFTKMLKDEPDIALAMLRELTRRLRVAELKAGAQAWDRLPFATVDTADGFEREELRTIARRAFEMAKASDDPSLRAALNLLGEVAENLAAKLPAAGSTAEAQGTS